MFIIDGFMNFLDLYINEVIYWLVVFSFIDVEGKVMKDVIFVYRMVNFRVELDIVNVFIWVFDGCVWVVSWCICMNKVSRNFSNCIIMVY